MIGLMQQHAVGMRAIPLAMIALLSAGCATMTQPYPQKNLYVISTGNAPALRAEHGTSVLRVSVVRIAQPFDAPTFVYKTGESAFTVDYYNGFLAAPDRLLTGELTSWLAQSGLFAAVVGGGTVDHDLTLESNITALYGDYSAKSMPKAVIEARFVLIREQGMAYNVVFQEVYREVEPLAGSQPEELIKGWGQAYRRVLEKLTANLQAVVVPASRPAP